MAYEDWYVLLVRTRFLPIIIQKLRKLNIDVIIPEAPLAVDDAYPRLTASTRHLFCRFPLENRLAVITIPGVIDITGVWKGPGDGDPITPPQSKQT